MTANRQLAYRDRVRSHVITHRFPRLVTKKTTHDWIVILKIFFKISYELILKLEAWNISQLVNSTSERRKDNTNCVLLDAPAVPFAFKVGVLCWQQSGGNLIFQEMVKLNQCLATAEKVRRKVRNLKKKVPGLDRHYKKPLLYDYLPWLIKSMQVFWKVQKKYGNESDFRLISIGLNQSIQIEFSI